jgi:hypothetical protein
MAPVMLLRQPFRLPPAGPVQAYRTFGYRRPLATHWRPATCAEVDCPHHVHGWTTTVDERTDLGMGQAHYIRYDSGRGFREHRNAAGLTVFTFPPGQRCFASGDHRLEVGLPPIYVVRDGDWRGNPTGWTRTHARGALWVEEWAEHQDRVRAERQRG